MNYVSPSEGFVLTDFVVATDVGRSRVRSMGAPGGQLILHGKPTITVRWPQISCP